MDAPTFVLKTKADDFEDFVRRRRFEFCAIRKASHRPY